jgi:[2Fe-2S] binding domain
MAQVLADRLSSGAPEPIDETSAYHRPETRAAVRILPTIYRQAAEMTDDEIRAALRGQLCRCTGYVGIVRAVRAAAAVEDARRTP